MQTGRAILSNSGFYKLGGLPLEIGFVSIIIPQSYAQTGVSLLEDHTSEIICPQNREHPLCILPYLPVLLPVSAVYRVKVQKYVICICKSANHSFGLNYSLWLLQNNMEFLIKHDVYILGVACLCIILYRQVSYM